MNVRIKGDIYDGTGKIPSDLACVVLNAERGRLAFTSIQELLENTGGVILRTTDDPPRFFFFIGSRLFETRTVEDVDDIYMFLKRSHSHERSQVEFDIARHGSVIGWAATTYSEGPHGIFIEAFV